jgi:hypothetical protein
MQGLMHWLLRLKGSTMFAEEPPMVLMLTEGTDRIVAVFRQLIR